MSDLKKWAAHRSSGGLFGKSKEYVVVHGEKVTNYPSKKEAHEAGMTIRRSGGEAFAHSKETYEKFINPPGGRTVSDDEKLHKRAAGIHREEATSRAAKGYMGVKQHEEAAKAHEKAATAIASGKKEYDVHKAKKDADWKSSSAASTGGRHGLTTARSEKASGSGEWDESKHSRDEAGKFS